MDDRLAVVSDRITIGPLRPAPLPRHPDPSSTDDAACMTTMATPANTFRVERATAADLPALQRLDAVCFPPGDPSRHPSAPGELDTGVAQSRILVARLTTSPDPTHIAGFLQFDNLGNQDYHMLGVGVAPQYRRQHVATQLVHSFLDEVRHVSAQGWAVTTTVSPSNTPMLTIVFELGFRAVRFLPHYFGPDHGRLYLRLLPSFPDLDSSARLLLPTQSLDQLAMLLSEPGGVVTGIIASPHGDCFDFQKHLRPDHALEGNEASASISLTGTLLASCTFLTGLGLLSTRRFPADILALLSVSLVGLIIALVVYANSAGDLARLKRGDFHRHMTIGNAFSETGGIYGLLHVVPTALTRLTGSVFLGALVASTTSAVLIWYHRYGFAVISRHNLPSAVKLPVISYLTISPLVGFASAVVFDSTYAWSVGNIIVLVTLTLVLVRGVEH